MADSTRPNPPDDSSAESAGSPSLDDLDSLLSAAADLAKELSTDLGGQVEPASDASAVDAASVDAESPEPADASGAEPVAGASTTGDFVRPDSEERSPPNDEEPADAVAHLDAQLMGVQELTARAAADIGTVEGVSGDPQILAALSSKSDAPVEPPALTKGDHAFLADLDDLTSAGDLSNLDPFGAPPPRGAGALKPPDPTSPAPDQAAPKTEKPSGPAPRMPDPPRRPAVAGLEDLMAPPPDSAPSEPSATKGRPGPSAAHVEPSVAKVPFGIAAPPAAPQKRMVAEPTPPTTPSPLASSVAGILGVLDAPFAWLPLSVKRICGWIAVAMLVAAAALQGRAMLHPSDVDHPDTHAAPSVHAGAPESTDETEDEQVSAGESIHAEPAQPAHE